MDPNVDWVFVSNLINEVRTMYPRLAWMLDVPQLADILVKAGLEGWDSGRVVAAIQGTEWWKTRNASAREFARLIQTDPATGEQQVQSLKTQVLQFARQSGYQITDAEALFIARSSMDLGRTTQEWQASIVAHYGAPKTSGGSPVIDNLKALAAQYAVPMSDATLQKWSQDILTGMVDENTFRSYLIEQAKSLFPGLANALDRGITVAQYVAPYAEIAAQELGVNPMAIDWRDPKWSAAIHQIDSKGAPSAMSLADWTRELRTNSIYGFDNTMRAQEMSQQLGRALLEKLGMAA